MVSQEVSGKLTVFTIFLICILIGSCRLPNSEPVTQISKTDSTSNIDPKVLSDSSRLVKHLDSLPAITFPFLSEFYNRSFQDLNLSEFKDKKLRNFPIKLIPTNIDGGGVDFAENKQDSLFCLTDTNYIGYWNLIMKTPKYLVIEVNDNFSAIRLVTMKYNLEVIDAINSGVTDPGNNSHWNANRHTIVNQDLSLILQHEYQVQTDEEYHYDKELYEENWFIDSTGYFRQKVK